MQKSRNIRSINCPRVWLPGIASCIVQYLPENEIPLTIRLVDKTTAQQFSNHKTVHLSLPSPSYAYQQQWGHANAFRSLTRKQRLKLLCLTAASGNTINLEIALDFAGLCATGEVLEAAAAAGQLEVCKLLRKRGCCPWGRALAAAARIGHKHVCDWMLEAGCSFDECTVAEAARGGNEDIMLWLLNELRRGVAAEDILGAAVEGLSLSALKRLYQVLKRREGQRLELRESQKGELLAAAAGSSTPDWQSKVEWLEALGYPRTMLACRKAAQVATDAVGRLQWLCRQGYPLDNGAVESAAGAGNLAALCFLIEERKARPFLCNLNEAAMHGRLTVLQYMQANDIQLNMISLAEAAAEQGHLSVVAWVVENMGAVTPQNCAHLLDLSAASGNIEVLSWLHERGWKCTKWAIGPAALSGCEEVMEWLVEQGCSFPSSGGPYISAASGTCDLAMVRCLHRLGCPARPDTLAESVKASGAPWPVLQCMRDLGFMLLFRPLVTWTEAPGSGLADSCPAMLEWVQQERQRRAAESPKKY